MTTKRTPSSAPAPTDLELMLYADGELEGERLLAVEVHLAGDEAAQRKLLALGVASGVVREHALASAAPADDLADRIMAAIEAEPVKAEERAPAPSKPESVVPLPRRPSNDNARGLFAVAAVAIAAAASFFFWGRASIPVEGPVGGPVDERAALTALPAREEAPRAEGDAEHGVEVAAVDFGARTGLVFYVPNGLAPSSTTTVVWLSDDSSGGDE